MVWLRLQSLWLCQLHIIIIATYYSLINEWCKPVSSYLRPNLRYATAFYNYNIIIIANIVNHFPLLIILIGSCLSTLYVMAFTSGLPSAGSDSPYQIQLHYNSGTVRTISLYDRPGDDYLENKGDLWQFSLSGCITLSAISQVSIVADGTDGWNIGSVVTLVRDSQGRIQVLTRNFGSNFWIDTDNGFNRPFILSLALSDVGSGMFLNLRLAHPQANFTL